MAGWLFATCLKKLIGGSKMTITINLDETQENADWLRAKPTFRQRMSQVAKALPGAWKINEYKTPDPSWAVSEQDIEHCTLIRSAAPAGGVAPLSIDARIEGDRIVLSALTVWDDQKNNVFSPDYSPRITVAASKTPDAIARDIVRRLLGDVEAYFSDAMEWKRTMDVYNAGKDEAIAEINGLWVKGEPRSHLWRTRVNGPDSVDFSVNSIPLALAVEMIEMIDAKGE